MMFGYILRREKKTFCLHFPERHPAYTRIAIIYSSENGFFPMGYPGVGRDFDQKYEFFFNRLGKNV